jgi:predicted regulator of Ras-like GTPase activity (Roadblock/LC7/MglB family)
VLEAFAVQVGSAFLATALLTAAGKVVAQHIASKRTDQDLASPAYHLAQVMQSSLRALLMGGWGDLDETLITGSTHSIVLRRLGQVEQSLFHLAVLERSGNPGLCRVLMRQTEPVLLRLAASS